MSSQFSTSLEVGFCEAINEQERKREMEWRIVHKYGETYAEGRYKGTEWSNWLFPISKSPKKYYIHIPELNVYRRNTSIG